MMMFLMLFILVMTNGDCSDCYDDNDQDDEDDNSNGETTLKMTIT